MGVVGDSLILAEVCKTISFRYWKVNCASGATSRFSGLPDSVAKVDPGKSLTLPVVNVDIDDACLVFKDLESGQEKRRLVPSISMFKVKLPPYMGYPAVTGFKS